MLISALYLHILVWTVLVCAPGSVTPQRITRQAPSFSNGEVLGTVGSHNIEEASGLAASRNNPGFLYTHNDHGDGPNIHVITTTGHRQSTITLSGVTSHDWEDIAVGKCSKGSNHDCIYIGDFGDAKPGAVNNIYKFVEPASVMTDADIDVSAMNTLEFSWNETDSETLMVDAEANVYIISKAGNGRGKIAQLPGDAWGTGQRVHVLTTAVINAPSTHNDPVSGDISPDGTEVLVKTHESIFYWSNSAGNDVDYVALLQTPGVHVPYIEEHQGEAVCWDATGRGYYTLGEGADQSLYHYTRT